MRRSSTALDRIPADDADRRPDRLGAAVELAPTGTDTTAGPAAADPGTAPAATIMRGLVAAGALVALIVATYVVGRWLQLGGTRLFTLAPPLTGRFDPRLPWRAGLPAAVGLAGVLAGPRLARRLGWRPLLWTTAGAALAWSGSLAFTDGLGGLLDPVRARTDYLASLPFVITPGAFLTGFVEGIERYSTHARAHPPGLLVGLWGMDHIGLSGAGWVAAAQHAAGAASVPALLLAVREVASSRAARTVAPFAVFMPATVAWGSGDAIFLGVATWSIALLVLATGRRDRRGDLLALAGGLLAGAAVFLSYGLVLLAAVPLAVGTARRRVRPFVLAATGVVAVTVAFAAAGFWWFDGLEATRREYALSIARFRPYSFFLVANLAAFGIALGPAVVAGAARLRDRRLWLLVGGGLIAIALADLSGMSKAEVERIWLPFVPWLVVATAAHGRQEVRGWLGAQVVWALVFQLAVRQQW